MNKNIIIFTDGSCIKTAYNKYYAGYGIHFPNKELPDISKPFLMIPITSQRAELYAILKALKKIIKFLEFDTITIYSDSEYSIKSLTNWIFTWVKNKWKRSNNKPVKNKDILEPLYKLIMKYKDKIKFQHVRSHTKQKDYCSIGNDKADKLALKGSIKSKKIINKIKQLKKN